MMAWSAAHVFTQLDTKGTKVGLTLYPFKVTPLRCELPSQLSQSA